MFNACDVPKMEACLDGSAAPLAEAVRAHLGLLRDALLLPLGVSNVSSELSRELAAAGVPTLFSGLIPRVLYSAVVVAGLVLCRSDARLGAPHGGMHRGRPRVPPRRVRRPCFCRTARGFASGVPHGRGVPRRVAAALPAVQTPLGQARLRSQASGIIEFLSAESC